MKGLGCLTGGWGHEAPGALARWRRATAACAPASRRRLALAFGVSLLLHAGLLLSLRTGRPAAPPSSLLYVTLAPAPVATADAPRTPAAAVAATPPAAAPAQEPPLRPASAPPAASQGAPSKPPDTARPEATERPALARSEAEPGKGTVGDLVAQPLGWPLLDPELRKELVARRLAVRVAVDPDGRASQVTLINHELSPHAVAALQDAIQRVRFQPGMRDGRAAPSRLATRLCFDDEGRFDEGSAECWRVP